MSLKAELESILSQTINRIETEEQARWQEQVEKGYQGAADSARKAAEGNKREATYGVHCQTSPENTKRLAEDVIAKISREGVRAVLDGGVTECRWDYVQQIKISF